MAREGSVAFGFFSGICVPLCVGPQPKVAASGAQRRHHRLCAADGSPRHALLRPQSSHFLCLVSTAPACAFAQRAHHRFVPSAGIAKFATFRWQSSHFSEKCVRLAQNMQVGPRTFVGMQL